MQNINYDRPRLVPLDAGCNYASGYCTTGNSNTCDTGIGVKSDLGGQCLGGQYARTCTAGTGVSVWNCKNGSTAQDCTSSGVKATTLCGNGWKAATCSTGNFT